MTQSDDPRTKYLGTNPRADFPINTIILTSAGFHAVLFALLPSHVKPLIKSYIVSMIHALVVVSSVIVYYSCSTTNMNQVNRIIGGGIAGTSDEIISYALSYSSGYFLYDFILMLFNSSIRTTTALIHHAVIMSGVICGLFTRIGPSCHFFLLFEELSTIPLNLKMIYHENKGLHNLFSYLFAACFFIVRLGYGSVIAYYTYYAAPSFIRMAWKLDDYWSIFVVIFELTLGFITRVLNVFWAYLILRKVFGRPKKRHQN